VTISSIRDKSLHLASQLFSSSLALLCVSDGDSAQLRLEVTDADSKQRQVAWTARKSEPSWEARIRLLARLLDVVSPLSASGRRSRDCDAASDADFVWAEPFEADLPLAFPCIALRAKFDQFSIVHATQLFTAVDMCTWSDEFSGGGDMSCPVFCCEDIYELCSSSGHVPGAPIPLQAGLAYSGCREDSRGQEEEAGKTARRAQVFNMVLPVAHTPLLFELYKGIYAHRLARVACA
jgi:hypothetical protein